MISLEVVGFDREPEMETRRFLRGRERELAQLTAILDTGSGTLVSLTGPAGIGKTALLAELKTLAAKAGYGVVQIGAERELRPENLRMDRAVLVAVDGVHWSATALGALEELLDRAARQRFVCVVTRRGDEPFEWPGDALEIDLPRLDDDTAALVVADLLGISPGPGVKALIACARGNPAVLVDLATAVRESGPAKTESDVAAIVDAMASEVFAPLPGAAERLPQRLSDVLYRSIAHLDTETRQTLDIAAVLGRSFMPDDVAEMLGRPFATLLPVFEQARAAGVVDCAERGMRFRHELMWSVLVHRIPVAMMGALHRQAVVVLRERGCSVVELASHAARGAFRSDFGTIELLRDAAARVLESNPREAGEMALRALEWADPDHEAYPRLVEMAVESCVRTGPVGRAVDLANAALSRPLPNASRDVVGYWLSVALTLQARQDEELPALECVREAGLLIDEERFDDALIAIKDIENGFDEVWRGAPRVLRARVELGIGKTTNALAEAKAALACARRTGVRLYLGDALVVLMTAALRDGDPMDELREDPLVGWARAEIADTVTLRWLDALHAEMRDDPSAVQDMLDELDEVKRRELFSGPSAVGVVRAAVVRKRFHWAQAAVEDLAAPVAVVRHARGLAHGDVEQLEQAAEGYRGTWDRASATEDLGVALLDGDRDAGVRYLQQSFDLYTEAEARRDVARVLGRLRAVGVVLRHWQRGTGELTGMASLTETERKVVNLVATGLTNQQVARRLYISRHTVAFHLRKVFRKLEITSRVELARYYRHEAG